MVHDAKDKKNKKDNLRMGTRITRAGLLQIWMFGRLTEGTIQEKKGKTNLTCNFQLS